MFPFENMYGRTCCHIICLKKLFMIRTYSRKGSHGCVFEQKVIFLKKRPKTEQIHTKDNISGTLSLKTMSVYLLSIEMR